MVLTVAEVAEVLKLSKATIYKMIDAGQLPHVRVANSIRVRREDLEAFLSQDNSHP